MLLLDCVKSPSAFSHNSNNGSYKRNVDFNLMKKNKYDFK